MTEDTDSSGFHAVMGYEQTDALFSPQSLAVHQLSSVTCGKDTDVSFVSHLYILSYLK